MRTHFENILFPVQAFARVTNRMLSVQHIIADMKWSSVGREQLASASLPAGFATEITTVAITATSMTVVSV